jgi:predicted ATPase
MTPTGIVTFLFTDIEGSTRRWETDAGAMRAALEKHDEVLREAIAGYGGSLFKHTGDGVCAAFASPRAAVDAAVAAQRILELPVRMGIATGEAEIRDKDYFGAVLNRAARVMSAGHGGQILLDGATAGLLSGVDLKALGERRLRDIAQPLDMFQVRANGLEIEFPPLRTLDPTPGNLRRPATSFIGRDAELVKLVDELRTRRFVTLTGVGGVGKTRLALEVAVRLTSEFPDGVWVIELAPVGDPGAVPEAVAAVLGIHQQPGMTLSDSVAAALDGRTRLLVFDNCEHVLDGAADLIEKILAASSTVRILATSREGLRVGDERLWPVRPLDVNTTAPTLFCDRGQDVSAGILFTESTDTSAVVEICQRLDGIPLAIELAASRLQSMTVGEVRDRLDDRFRLLVGSRRGLERHQTLRHAVAWSYDLLDDFERTLLQRCSVFAGGFDLQAATAVGGGGDDFATLDLLDSLVRKSLIVADRASDRTRFAMLETIRQFAEEQLVHSGSGDAVRDAHARYFAGRETAVLALWDGPRQRDAYAWFAIELANLRAAFRWAADHDDLDTASAIAVFATFLGFWVEQFEPVAWAEELIEPTRTVEHRRLAQLYAMATQCYAAGRLDDAIGYADATRLAIDSERFDPLPYDFEAWLGGPYIWTGQSERWLASLSNMIAREQSTRHSGRPNLAIALNFTGADDAALEASKDLLAFADAADNPRVASFALLAYGYARRNTDPAAAQEVYRRGLMIARESGNHQLESHLAGNLSLLGAIHGDAMDALDYLTLAIRNHYDSGSFSLMLSPLVILGAVFARLGRNQPAATISGFAGTPLTSSQPEVTDAVTHLRDVLGDEVYESLARAGAAMTPAAMAGYAFEQIDHARAELQ